MRRKPLIITLLVVLLLIAGGATAFHFLRQRDQPPVKLAEIQSYFHQLPAEPGWIVTGSSEARRAVPTGSGWLEKFGLRRTKEFQEHTYWLANSRSHRLGHIKLYREDERVVLLDVFASTPADAEEISRLLLGKFPRLLPILKRYP